ncbi:sepH Cytokinesis protein sepH [Candida maltosa Xu316]|uniref:non-specific serine/threonine protein kinase n=1 Tax=Candida maltosa (strain Xu316) TaxID=1245528 RepID=M3K7B8_CANMX|nr:Cell division control protein, putative [Candida maltosa Xu316]
MKSLSTPLSDSPFLNQSKPGSRDDSYQKSINKEATLSKYKETEQYEDIEGFENLEELSFSKFSNISGGSVILKNEPDHDPLSSPFAKKIQQDLNIELTRDQSRPYFPSVHPIYELETNDENSNSPFIDNNNNHHHCKPNENHSKCIMHNKMRLATKQNENYFKPSFPYNDFQSTPKHQRASSFKISVTPAQKLEDKNLSKNALGDFKLGPLVGNGAFASVYRAINLKTNKVIAIKQIRLEPGQDVATLMGEIDLLKILNHPNIVKYHGFIKTHDSLNVLLEYCEGGSLRQLYKRLKKGLPESQIINYVRQILQGLNYLHEQGVVHRDVKAANVLLTENDHVKLADFGVATKVTSQHLSIVGTPNWMAPETVLGGEGICTASDIWSLGATIIELFTMNPPYHDFNPMAALHAIGTDEHPPLPKNISSFAKDFLLECFQKQSNLRISAKLLLQHKWLNPAATIKTSMSTLLKQPSTVFKSMKNYSEANDEDNWDKDFTEVKMLRFNNVKPTLIDLDADIGHDDFQRTVYSKKELLNKFTEEENDDSIGNNEFSTLHVNKLKFDSEDVEDSDPFLNIEIENFDTNELEVQSKMEYLVTRLSRKLEQAQAGQEDAISVLVKVTGRMLHLIKKYPVSHDTLIRDHGILSLLELLDSYQDISGQQQLWYHCLSILNYVFEDNLNSLENFCFLGGIPIVSRFRNSTYDIQVRLQVVRFVGILNTSEKALSMFVSCGGLRIVSKFVEGDLDLSPKFPLVGIESIHNILAKELSRSKSDLCRILSKHGVIFWLMVLLNQLIKNPKIPNYSQKDIQTAIDKIVDIIKYFSQSETRVRIFIGTTDLFKLMFNLFDSLSFSHQLVLLKFIKSMSCISEVLKHLYQAEILEFVVKLLKVFVPSKTNYKEMMNVLAPIVYNVLTLNYEKESEFINLGGLPYLKNLSMIDLPFRQFILPVICEFVHGNTKIRNELKKQGIVNIYLNLLLDTYWQSNALDSIYLWYKSDPQYIRLDSAIAIDCLVGGFLLPKVSNLESTLEIYLKLLTSNQDLTKNMSNMTVINNILMKLSLHDNKNPVILLSYLKVMKCLIKYLVSSKSSLGYKKPVKNSLQSLKSRSSSLLVEGVATEILQLIG